MQAFKQVRIIYNPKSTGKSEHNARALQAKLQKKLPNVSIAITPTQHKGHAIELAKNIAESKPKTLIVSSSGDGGYHEVINGVMQAKNSAKNTVCAVLASGNANDHSRTMQTVPLWRAIVKGEVTNIDLLKFTFKEPGATHVRYAHSYAGLGITPVMAKEVNNNSFNRWQELLLAFRVFYRYTPFRIQTGGKNLLLDSMIFSNINQMAKVFKLTKQNNPNDGLFRIITFKHTKKRLFAVKILKAIIGRNEEVTQAKTMEFKVLAAMPMQLDGEVIDLPKDTKVTIEAAEKILATIV